MCLSTRFLPPGLKWITGPICTTSGAIFHSFLSPPLSRAKPRNLQFRPPGIKCLRGKPVLFIGSSPYLEGSVPSGLEIKGDLLPSPHPMRALLSPLSFRAKPRNLQFRPPGIKCLRGKPVLFIGSPYLEGSVPSGLEIKGDLLPPPHPMRALLSPLSFRAKPRNLQFRPPGIKQPGDRKQTKPAEVSPPYVSVTALCVCFKELRMTLAEVSQDCGQTALAGCQTFFEDGFRLWGAVHAFQ